MPFSLQLFSGPRLFQDHNEQTLKTNRTALLFSYLAYQADWVKRDELLILFWPDMREAKARQNLRTLLYKSTKEPFAVTLEVEETRVRWLADTDVHRFQDAMTIGDWKKATGLYRGTFLANYKGTDSAEFEDWLEQTREELRLSWHDAALKVAESHISDTDYSKAKTLLQSILASDFLAEDAVRLLMQTQAESGQKSAALKTFQAFQESLSRELDMPVTAETQALADSIKETAPQAEASAPVRPQKKLAMQGVHTAALPQALTPFIGRTLELLEIAQLLTESDLRMITLLGHGGMGKSRLALQVLHEHKENFKDGVAFVSLAPLSAVSDIPAAVAESLNIRLSGESTVQEEVITFFRDKELLVVFDNFEHLLEGASFVQELIQQSGKSKFICTSRELLKIAHEHIYDVIGLNLPDEKEVSHPEAYDAVQFFLRSARRVRSDFRIEQIDKSSLVQLCQKLQGMPLALELASTWLRLFSLEDLVQELEQDFELLESSGQEVNERHKSMRVVFEQSWSRLDEKEKQVLADLSVFQGGFDRQAATKVTQASARVLLSLVNKSLLRTTASGRFSILEVIKQYAAEKQKNNQLAEKHASYYLDLVAELGKQFRSENPRPHLLKIEVDLENIKAAWRWSVRHNAFDKLEPAEKSLSFYFDLRTRLQEGIALFKEAIDPLKLQNQPVILAKLLVSQAILFRWAGMLDASGENCELAVKLILPDDDPNTYFNALTSLSYVYEFKSDINRAKAITDEAYQMALDSQDEALIASATFSLATAEYMVSNYQEATKHFDASLQNYRKANDAIGMVEVLSNYAEMKLELGQIGQAKDMCEEALDLAIKNGDTGFVHVCKSQLAECAFEAQDYEASENYLIEALELVKEAGSTGHEIINLCQLAQVKLATGDVQDAYPLILEAFKLVANIHSPSDLMTIYFAWAVYLYKHGLNEAQDFFYILSIYPATSPSMSKKVSEYLINAVNNSLSEYEFHGFDAYYAFMEKSLDKNKKLAGPG